MKQAPKRPSGDVWGHRHKHGEMRMPEHLTLEDKRCRVCGAPPDHWVPIHVDTDGTTVIAIVCANPLCEVEVLK